MKLKSSVKWAIAAAATVTTVTVSVGMIANAYTYNWDETSGGGYGIFEDGNDKIEKEYYRKGYDFEFSDQKPALEQVAKFALSVDIKDLGAPAAQAHSPHRRDRLPPVRHRRARHFEPGAALRAGILSERPAGAVFQQLCGHPRHLLQAANLPLSPGQRPCAGYAPVDRL